MIQVANAIEVKWEVIINIKKLFSYVHWKWPIMTFPMDYAKNVFSPNSGHSFIQSANKLYLSIEISHLRDTFEFAYSIYV